MRIKITKSLEHSVQASIEIIHQKIPFLPGSILRTSLPKGRLRWSMPKRLRRFFLFLSFEKRFP